MKKLTHNFILRIDDRTLELLQLNRDRLNTISKTSISSSEYIRQLIHKDYIDSIGFNKNVFKEATRDLAGLGNNINQIAHNLNMGINSYDQMEKLERCMNDIYVLRETLSSLQRELF